MRSSQNLFILECKWVFELNVTKEHKYPGLSNFLPAGLEKCTCCVRTNQNGLQLFNEKSTVLGDQLHSGHLCPKKTLKNVLFQKSGHGDFIKCQRWPSPKMSSRFLCLILETPLKYFRQKKNDIFIWKSQSSERCSFFLGRFLGFSFSSRI